MNMEGNRMSVEDRRDMAARDIYLHSEGKSPVRGIGSLCRKLGYPVEAVNVTPLYDQIESRGYGKKDGERAGTKLWWNDSEIPDEWKEAVRRGEAPSGGAPPQVPPTEPPVSEPKNGDLGPRQQQEARRDEARAAGGAVNQVLEQEAEELAVAAIAPYVRTIERAMHILPLRARLLLANRVLRLVMEMEGITDADIRR